MDSTPIAWEHSLSDALKQLGRERRFVLADFSREH